MQPSHSTHRSKKASLQTAGLPAVSLLGCNVTVNKRQAHDTVTRYMFKQCYVCIQSPLKIAGKGGERNRERLPKSATACDLFLAIKRAAV